LSRFRTDIVANRQQFDFGCVGQMPKSVGLPLIVQTSWRRDLCFLTHAASGPVVRNEAVSWSIVLLKQLTDALRDLLPPIFYLIPSAPVRRMAGCAPDEKTVTVKGSIRRLGGERWR
jgi:hypothetical protein